ncbi:hypothetical protein [Rhodanobacter thiooxydans]|uniref:hypothetical protein n=1 Tax=Rhodanobacter thiooxydans TaxID=416169 RepID=UPI0012DC8C7C|nr:hypothetical protein [Rhodanobacter thiooxydans]
MAASKTYLQEVLADSPVFAFTCNETTGTSIADATGNAHPGTISGTYALNQPPMTAGLGKSIAFTAGRIFLPFNSAFMYSNNWAIELVAKFTGTALGQVFGFFDSAAPNGGPAVYVNNGAVGSVLLRDSTGAGSTVSLGGLIDGKFRHLFLGRRGPNLEAWVNGDLTGLATNVAVYKPTSNPAMSLMQFRDGSQSVPGGVDEAAYYTSMPSSDRIKIHAARAMARQQLGGSANLDTGSAASKVLVRRWDTHEHVDAVTPDGTGKWTSLVDPGDYEVTTIGPSGYQPICHGPVTALDF